MQKIWINVNPKIVDLSYLFTCFEGRVEVTAEAVENDPAKYLPLAKASDIVISTLETWNKETLSQIRGHVRMIQKFGMGLDNIDLDEAARNGILVANVLGANSASVAEIALLHILNVQRRFFSCAEQIRAGQWPTPPQGLELDGKTVGLLGFGNIARHLVRMLSGFSVKILAYDPFPPEMEQYPDVELVTSKEALFQRSDIVSLHIPCTPETYGSINKSLFDKMKQGACLVNTCRGGVINEKDLVEALRSGKIAAAGLDVLQEEPPSRNLELLSMENVTITSHMGAETKEAVARSLVIMCEAIDTFLRGELPKFVRNVKELEQYKGKGKVWEI